MDDGVDDLRPDPGHTRGQDAGEQGEQREHDRERSIGGPNEHQRAPAVLEQPGETAPQSRAARVSLGLGGGERMGGIKRTSTSRLHRSLTGRLSGI